MATEIATTDIPLLDNIKPWQMYLIIHLHLTAEQFAEVLNSFPIGYGRQNNELALCTYLYLRQNALPELYQWQLNELYTNSRATTRIRDDAIGEMSHEDAILICRLPVDIYDIVTSSRFTSLKELAEVCGWIVWDDKILDIVAYSKLRHKGIAKTFIADWLHDGLELTDIADLTEDDALVHIDDFKLYQGNNSLSELVHIWLRARSIDIKEKVILDMLRDEFDITQYLELRIEAELSHDAAIKVLEDPELLEVFKSMK